MIERRFGDIWQPLQGKKPHLPHFLAEIHLRGIRGIDDLRVVLDYPVSVIAAATPAASRPSCSRPRVCLPRAGRRGQGLRAVDSVPDYRPGHGVREDEKREVIVEFDYTTPDGRRSMRWRRAKGWNRSFLGRKNAPATGAAGLSADAQQPQQPLRGARRAQHVAVGHAAARDAADRLTDRVRSADAAVPLRRRGGSVERHQEPAVRRPGTRRRLFRVAHGRRGARHPAAGAGDCSAKRGTGTDRRGRGGVAPPGSNNC